MKKIIFAVLFFLVFVSLAKADEFNPQEVGYLEADVNFYSFVETNEKLDELNYSLYIIPEDYSSLQIVSSTSPEYSIKKDDYGNNMLVFYWRDFTPQNYEVKMKIRNYAKFSAPQRTHFPYNPPKETWEYLSEGNHSVISDEIRNFAINLTKDSKDSFDAVTKISSWIYFNLKYDSNYSQMSLPSDWVFENRKGTCDEFTNLFISMSRSVGIPSRYVAGVVYSKGGWGYHAWAEVYLGEWVPVDPTWNEIGWIDATHIKLGNFMDGSDVRVSAEYLSTRKAIVRISQPSVIVKIDKTRKIEKKFTTTIDTYPHTIGKDDYSIVSVKIETKSQGCLATAIKIKPRVDESGNPIVSVYGNRLISICPGETKEYHFIVKSRENLNENYKYYNLADIYTFLGDENVIDLEIDPREKKDSFLDLDLDKQVVEIGDKINYFVSSDSEYKVYSDLPIGGNAIAADETGEHYIMAITKDGNLIKKNILVENTLNFKIKEIKKPKRVTCGEIFNVSFIIENLRENYFEINVNTSSELEKIHPIKERIEKEKKITLSTKVIENCTGDDQFLNINVNSQRIFEKIHVEKPKRKWSFIQDIIDFITGLFRIQLK